MEDLMSIVNVPAPLSAHRIWVVTPTEHTLVSTCQAGRSLHAAMWLYPIECVFIAATTTSQHCLNRIKSCPYLITVRWIRTWQKIIRRSWDKLSFSMWVYVSHCGVLCFFYRYVETTEVNGNFFNGFVSSTKMKSLSLCKTFIRGPTVINLKKVY